MVRTEIVNGNVDRSLARSHHQPFTIYHLLCAGKGWVRIVLDQALVNRCYFGFFYGKIGRNLGMKKEDGGEDVERGH